MKRIFTTILSVVLATTLFAQETKSTAEIVNELAKGRTIAKRQYNYGRGYVTNSVQFRVGMWELCSIEECNKEDMGYPIIDGLTPTREAIPKERERVKNICSTLDSLMKISADSYHYETPIKNNDTIAIIYSLCIKNAKDSIRKFSLRYQYLPASHSFAYRYPDATESITFTFISQNKFSPCDKHKMTHGDFIYTYQKPMPKDQCTAFDQKTYLESILPVLKQKEIKSWDFNWTLDERFDNDRQKYFDGFYGMRSVRGANGKTTYAGKATGTIYFIPKEKEKMAVNVFNTIDSLTQIHINKYPQQIYDYEYDIPERVISRPASTLPTVVIEEYDDKNDMSNKFHLNIAKTDDGYYLAIINSEKAYGFPKEWYKLKSYVNGKKEYIVYQSNNQGETEPLLFPSIPK